MDQQFSSVSVDRPNDQRDARSVRDTQVVDRPARLTASLRGRGVRAVAVTVVDNAGVARVKTFPLEELESSARWGIGLSPAFGVFLVNDSLTRTDEVAAPTGDLRLIPDLAALRELSAEPGWAWAPADQYTQDGEVFGCCQRSFLRRMVAHAGARDLELRFGCELEWFLGREEGGNAFAAHRGPAYGFAVLAELGGYARELIEAFADAGIHIGQFHPEYAPGQLEVSLPPSEPVAAADLNVFARQLIRSVSHHNGWRASFSPAVVPEQVGNGGHLHCSLWREGRNLLAGGDGPHGMTEPGEAFVAGVLAELPGLLAVGAPSVASYLRMRSSQWAGVYACWGRENREAALRFVTGMTGNEQTAANFEIKCFDQAANPYLAVGATIAAGLAGIDRGLRLPRELLDDPATYTDAQLQALGVDRLPLSLKRSLELLECSKLMRAAMGPTLFEAFTAVRRAESQAYAEQSPEQIVTAHRWRY